MPETSARVPHCDSHSLGIAPVPHQWWVLGSSARADRCRPGSRCALMPLTKRLALDATSGSRVAPSRGFASRSTPQSFESAQVCPVLVVGLLRFSLGSPARGSRCWPRVASPRGLASRSTPQSCEPAPVCPMLVVGPCRSPPSSPTADRIHSACLDPAPDPIPAALLNCSFAWMIWVCLAARAPDSHPLRSQRFALYSPKTHLR